MLSYNLNDSDLVENQVDDIVELDFELSARFQTSSATLAYHISKAFFCQAIIMKTNTGFHKVSNKIRFIGAKSDIEVSGYIYSYLLQILSTKAEDYYKSIKHTKNKWSPLEAKKVKSDFEYGFVIAISEKLKAIRDEREVNNQYDTKVSNALVVVKNDIIQAHIDNKIGKLKTTTKKVSYNKEHFGAGHNVGNATGIHRGIDASDGQKVIA